MPNSCVDRAGGQSGPESGMVGGGREGCSRETARLAPSIQITVKGTALEERSRVGVGTQGKQSQRQEGRMSAHWTGTGRGSGAAGRIRVIR